MLRRLLFLSVPVAIALLLFIFLVWASPPASAQPNNQTVPPLPTPTSTAITVTMWTYDDLNNNRWRDPNESPYLPSFVGAIYCYHFASEQCGYESGSSPCLAEGYANTIELPRRCAFSVTRSHAIYWDLPISAGKFTTGDEPMSIYFPSNLALCCPPDNLLGTPTPTFTPTPTPTRTFTPTPTFTHTATPKPDVQPDATATPRPGPSTNTVFLPNVNK